MYYPNLRQEKKLQRKGFKYIAGLDEVGKGAWAGPIVAGAVILNPQAKIKGIKDSKLLRKPDRKKLFTEIVETALAWSTAAVSQAKIDKIGIQQANILAMQQALGKLSVQPNYLLVDALTINYNNLPCQGIIKGDYRIKSIAAASIVAKVVRDEIMDKLDEEYPAYGFKHHKGYGTSHHLEMLNKHGVCSLHRKTWEPMKYFLES